MTRRLLILIICISVLFAQETYEEYLRKKEKEYQNYEKSYYEQYQEYIESDIRGYQKLIKETIRIWGEQDLRFSTRTEWVEYDKTKTRRSIVDFEFNTAKIEIVIKSADTSNQDLVQSDLREAVEKLVKDKGMTKDYDIPQEKARPLMDEPVLKDQLILENGDTVTEKTAGKFADEMIDKMKIIKNKIPGKEDMIKVSIKFPLAPFATRRRAEALAPTVKTYAEKYDLPSELIMSIIHTESSFNPKAHNEIPAYGLMQLVPKTGALDAYRFIYKINKIPTANELLTPEKNIELGCAYLHLLGRRYLRSIHDETSRLYCTIAGYNTGPGNVWKTFSGDVKSKNAVPIVNNKTPKEVYFYLIKNLPYEETRHYVKKVVDRMSFYQ